MNKRVACVLAGAVALAGIGLATAAPSSAAISGGQYSGPITVKGERGQCLTAAKAEAGAELYVFGCIPGDALQHWGAITTAGIVLIGLESHPTLVIGGIPGNRGAAKLINVPDGADVPVPQGIFIKGNWQAHTPQIQVKNQANEYLTLPSRGHNVFWSPRNLSTIRWNRTWITGPWSVFTEV